MNLFAPTVSACDKFRMDAVRKIILDAVRDRPGVTLKGLSKQLKKNDAYLQQFISRGVPEFLPEKVRGQLADLLDLDESALGAPEPSKKKTDIPPFVQIDRHDVPGALFERLSDSLKDTVPGWERGIIFA